MSAAERLAEKAFAAYSAKDYALAVALYKQAYDAAPSADILYNLARIYDTGLRDRPLAMTFYRRYVADPDADAERIRTANERLLDLRAAEEAAAMESTPAASRTGAAAASREEAQGTDVAQGDGTGAADRGAEPGARLKLAGRLLVGAGAAGLVLGAGFGLWAKSDADTAKKSCDGNLCRTQGGVDAAKDGASKATVANIGIAAGGATLATGVVLWVLGARRSRDDANTERLALRPVLSGSLAGAQVTGSF